MVKRINAFKIVFNFLLTIVELLIGVRFLLGTFGSNQTANALVRDVGMILEELGMFTSGVLVNKGMEKSIAALLLMFGFMLFSLILITMLPAMTERKERELELIDD